MPNASIGAVAELAASHHGVVSRKQAAQLGMASWKVRSLIESGLLREPVPNALVLAGAPATWQQNCAVAAAALDGRGLLSCRAAARSHGFDGCREPIVEATTLHNTRLIIPGVIIHRAATLPEEDRFEIDGIPVTGVARTLCDLGSVVGPERVLQALDSARRRGCSLQWIEETARRLHRPGQRGTGVLLGFLEQVGQGNDVLPGSWFERLVERCIAAPDLPPVVRQYEIRNAEGRVVARPDLAMPDIKLGLEAHSRQFHFGSAYEQLDESRDLAAAAQGWELIYLGWHAHLHPARLLAHVRTVVRARQALLASRG
jgi:hypothetical protein